MATFKVVSDCGNTVLETDDWVEAQVWVESKNWPPGRLLRVRGTHPSHDWAQDTDSGRRRCRNCGGWDNGSYGSQSPCGYDWSRDSLASALEREMKARAEWPSLPGYVSAGGAER